MAAARILRLSALVMAGLWWSVCSPAQTLNLSVVSGNGQLICPTCAYGVFRIFEPMTVLVTDSSGNPVSGTQINWTVQNPTSASVLLNFMQTITGADGTSSNIPRISVSGSMIAHQVVASIPGASGSVTFNLTQGAPETTNQYIFGQVLSPLYVTLTGAAGTTASSQIQVQIQNFLQPVPNVSVRLIPASSYTPGASISCATASGADQGSVLTGPDGTATCTPVFGSTPSDPSTNGIYRILIGGVSNSQLNSVVGPVGYTDFGNLYIQVTPGVPGGVRVISGNNQLVNPGQSVAVPLVAEVDSIAGNPLDGEPVTWTVSPASSAVLSQTTTTTGPDGRVSTGVTLTASAVGTVTITATSGGVSANFSVYANFPLTGLTKASGDGQATPVNTAFGQPLVVQVNGPPGKSVAGVAVQFAITGPATLNNKTVSTDANGRAAVTVTAGSTTGPVTVTASSGTFSVTFTLTVAPAGPVLTTSSFLNGAGFYATDSTHSALAPCGIGTIIAPGIAPGIQGVVTGPMIGPLPYQLAQVSVSFNGSRAPLYNVANVSGQQQVAFQVPCDVVPSDSVPATVTVSGIAKTINVVVRSAGPGIFEYAMSDGTRRAVIIRPDGSFVSLENPAHAGETLRLLITGMGQVRPSLATNSVPIPGVDSTALGVVTVSVNNTPVATASGRRAPELIGIDEVTFQLPSGTPSGSNVPLSVSVAAVDNPQNPQSSNGSAIPVQ
jgi:uncharacterized protein (TIGR03437 family)